MVTAEEVVALVRTLEAHGVTLWLDGGWCVEALVGGPARPHEDLDVAVERQSLDRLWACLSAVGFVHTLRDGSTDCCFVLSHPDGRVLDVHVFAQDEDGEPSWGIPYPRGALLGWGELLGQPVRCVAPSFLFQFKTAYAPRPKDLEDVQRLSARFGFAIPPSHLG